MVSGGACPRFTGAVGEGGLGGLLGIVRDGALQGGKSTMVFLVGRIHRPKAGRGSSATFVAFALRGRRTPSKKS